MTRTVGLIALLAALAAALPRLAAEDRKAEEKKAGTDGWVQLFNGKDLTGWKLHPDPNPGAIAQVLARIKDDKLVAYDAKARPAKGERKETEPKEVHLWRVEDGVLIGSGPSTHLFTERDDYQNFHVRAEARINDHGNSGLYFRTKFGPGFPKGYEAQINATHGDKIKTGSLYPSFEVSKENREKMLVMNTAAHKPDEWFTEEVIAEGNHIVIKVNGKTTVDFVDPHSTYRKGHFALQGHDPGTVVQFRKIEVRELPATAKKE